jgi:hypothetical protein
LFVTNELGSCTPIHQRTTATLNFEIVDEAAEEPKEDFDVQAAARALLASRQLKPKRVIKDGVDTKQFVSAGS